MFDHWGSVIYWDHLTWEAAATLMAGFAAVGGAILIGLNQVKIQRRQVALQQLELRRLLFDVRRPVYESTRDWLAFILQRGHIPNRRYNQDFHDRDAAGVRAEIERQQAIELAFLAAIEQSRFVFSPHVFDALEQFWLQANEMHFHRVSQDAQNADRGAHIDEETRLLKWFAEQHRDLSGVFGDELKVSDGGPTTFRALKEPRKAEEA